MSDEAGWKYVRSQPWYKRAWMRVNNWAYSMWDAR